MKKLLQTVTLFITGGLLYGLTEILWRRRTHWSMILTGGICFCVLYHIFKAIKNYSVWFKCFIGSIVITITEFLAGFVFNYCMGLSVWDYSDHRLNFCGQICLLYSFLWGLLTLPVLVLCSFIGKRKAFTD